MSSAPSWPSQCKTISTISREAGLAPEWKELLRHLDRLAQIRIRHRGADWLVPPTLLPQVTMLFKSARIALPPHTRKARPPLPTRPNPPENAAAALDVVPR
jgi:hypothetical protein